MINMASKFGTMADGITNGSSTQMRELLQEEVQNALSSTNNLIEELKSLILTSK